LRSNAAASCKPIPVGYMNSFHCGKLGSDPPWRDDEPSAHCVAMLLLPANRFPVGYMNSLPCGKLGSDPPCVRKRTAFAVRSKGSQRGTIHKAGFDLRPIT